jgi:hypothetical protein
MSPSIWWKWLQNRIAVVDAPTTADAAAAAGVTAA